jgi:hypothetical protein
VSDYFELPVSTGLYIVYNIVAINNFIISVQFIFKEKPGLRTTAFASL